jgi:hypothetical protein
MHETIIGTLLSSNAMCVCVCAVEPTSNRFISHVAHTVMTSDFPTFFFCTSTTRNHYISTPCLGKSDSLFRLTPKECIW